MAALLSWRRDSAASLFERIQGKGVGSSRYTSKQALLASIKTHLNQVLNTRPGACQSAVMLGVVDLNDATAAGADFQHSIEQAIKTCIETYEPRITEVSVKAQADDTYGPMLLRFYIRAHVDFDDIGDVVEFNILLDNNRHYCFD